MPIVIKNIKNSEINYNNKSFKDFDKIVEYVKLIKPDYKLYLPKKPKARIEFEITNTVSDFANCIRRFLLDEIMVYSMHIDVDNIETNDKFILNDHLKKRLELIPFQQQLSNPDKLKLSLTIKNTTDDIMTVYSRYIKITDDKGKELNSDDYFSGNIPMIQLRSDKFLNINNITITTGYGKEDSGKFCLLSNVSYEILDVIPYEESKFEKKGESSLNSNPSHFKIGFTTHRNIDPENVIHLCCNGIIERLTVIQKEISNVKSEETIYFSDLLELEIKNNIKIYHFKGEFWTIANIIARYCYLEFPAIKFVCANIIHPSNEESIVKIIHPNSLNILTAAIKNIISDINILKKNFKNHSL